MLCIKKIRPLFAVQRFLCVAVKVCPQGRRRLFFQLHHFARVGFDVTGMGLSGNGYTLAVHFGALKLAIRLSASGPRPALHCQFAVPPPVGAERYTVWTQSAFLGRWCSITGLDLLQLLTLLSIDDRRVVSEMLLIASYAHSRHSAISVLP